MRQSAQSPLRRIFASRVFLIALTAAAVLTALGFARAYYEDYTVRQEIKSLENEVKSLEKKKLESLEILKYVSSPNFVEDKARTELNMKKPDEQVAVITPAEDQAAPAASQAGQVGVEPLQNLVKWWYYFTIHRLPEPAPVSPKL